MDSKRIKNLSLTALFIALVIIGSRIYVGTHDTIRFHLGNSMCLLSAFVLSPLYGGVASGLGSMIFDLLFYPQGGMWFIVTFISKFFMGYTAGIIFRKTSKAILSGIIGEIVYIILYVIKTYVERRFVLSMAFEAVVPIVVAKTGAAVVNAVIAIVIATVLYNIIKRIKI